MNTAVEICMWICLLYGLNGLIKILHELSNLSNMKLTKNNTDT